MEAPPALVVRWWRHTKPSTTAATKLEVGEVMWLVSPSSAPLPKDLHLHCSLGVTIHTKRIRSAKPISLPSFRALIAWKFKEILLLCLIPVQTIGIRELTGKG